MAADQSLQVFRLFVPIHAIVLTSENVAMLPTSVLYLTFPEVALTRQILAAQMLKSHHTCREDSCTFATIHLRIPRLLALRL